MAKRRAESELPRTVEEFDRWHAEQPERWEFIAGVPVMMAPASMPHAIIKGNVYAALRTKLAGSRCIAFVDGPEVKSHELSAIPDVVACGEVDLASSTLSEPVAVVEILSPSSERDDIGRKWQGYCLIPSLQHYLVVAQRGRFVTVHTRTGAASFDERVYHAGEIPLAAIGATLTVEEIYQDVASAEPAADA